MIGFCPLASGSKGNCSYLGTHRTRILIDAGLSVSMIEKKLLEISVEAATIEAVMITHEHTDHIKGVAQIAEKWKIPILANAETAKGIMSEIGSRPRFKIFTTGESFLLGDLEVQPFSIPHDTLDPVGFCIKAMGLKIGLCTDLGYVTSMVRKMLDKCDYLVLEANHQPSMVHACPRPQIYKDRVLGRQGHLSNEAAAELLLSIVHDQLKHVYLAHLSSECNSQELALQIIGSALDKASKKVPLSIAYQDRISQSVHFL